MIGTLLSFTALAVSARELSNNMDTLELLFFRTLVGFVIMAAVVGRSGLASVRTRRLGGHALRNTIHFGGQYAWFLGLTLLPLADLFALEFTTPIWTAILAVLILGERLNRGRIAAIVLGFLGILIILKPGLEIVNAPSLIVIASAMFFAGTHTVTKLLTATESTVTILFYMFLMQLPLTFVLSLFVWTAPRLADLHWIIAVGATSVAAHYCLTNAFKLADASFVIPVDFLRLPLVAVVGFALYGEAIEITIFLGAAVIVAGSYYNIRHENARLKEKEKETRGR